MRYVTHSPEQTRAIASLLAEEIARTKKRSRSSGAFVLACSGTLGSGKTTFIQGLVRGFGISRRTPSPTFTLMRRYPIPRTALAYRRGFRSVVHMDAYRVHSPSELAVIRFGEWITDPSAIVVIEWADLVRALLPKDALWVRFSHQKKEDGRSLAFSPFR